MLQRPPAAPVDRRLEHAIDLLLRNDEAVPEGVVVAEQVRHVPRTLAREAERWAEELPARWDAAGRPYEQRLVDETIAWIRELVPPQGAKPE